MWVLCVWVSTSQMQSWRTLRSFVCQVWDGWWQWWGVGSLLLMWRVAVQKEQWGTWRTIMWRTTMWYTRAWKATPNSGLETATNAPTIPQNNGSSRCGGLGMGPFTNQVPSSMALPSWSWPDLICGCRSLSSPQATLKLKTSMRWFQKDLLIQFGEQIPDTDRSFIGSKMKK